MSNWLADVRAGVVSRRWWIAVLCLTLVTRGGIRVASGEETSKSPETTPAREGPPAVDLFGDALPSGAIARLGTLRLRHWNSVESVAISPAGKILASAGQDGRVKFWSFPDCKLIREVRGSTYGQVEAIAFSADGSRLVAGCRKGIVYVFRTETGEELQRIVDEASKGVEECYGVAISPDGKTVAVVGKDAVVRAWDSESGQKVLQYKFDDHEEMHCGAVEFSPDGKRLAAARSDRLVTLDLKTAKVAVTPADTDGFRIRSLQYTADGKRLVAGGKGESPAWQGVFVCVWNSEDGKLVREWKPNRSDSLDFRLSRDTCDMAVSGNGKLLVTGHYKELRIWDFEKGTLLHTCELPGSHHARSRGVAFSPDGNAVAIVGPGNMVRVFNTRDGSPLGNFHQGHNFTLMDLEWLDNGKQLISTGQDHSIRRWDVRTGRELRELHQNYPGTRQFLTLRDNQTYIAVGEGHHRDEGRRGRANRRKKAGTLTFFDAATDKPSDTVYAEFPVTALAVSPDNRTLAVASGWGERAYQDVVQPVVISLWDVATRKRTGEMKGHTQGVGALQFTSDGKTLISAAQDGTLRRWDVAEPRLLTTKVLKQVRIDPVTKKEVVGKQPQLLRVMMFAIDGSFIVTQEYGQNALSIRNLNADAVPTEKQIPLGDLDLSHAGMCLSPDGKILAINCRGSKGRARLVRFVELATGKTLHEFPEGDRSFDCMKFSPDSRRLACGTSIGTILIYELPEKSLPHKR